MASCSWGTVMLRCSARRCIAGWRGSSSECPFIGNAHHDIFGRCPHYATANQFRATIFLTGNASFGCIRRAFAGEPKFRGSHKQESTQNGNPPTLSIRRLKHKFRHGGGHPLPPPSAIHSHDPRCKTIAFSAATQPRHRRALTLVQRSRHKRNKIDTKSSSIGKIGIAATNVARSDMNLATELQPIGIRIDTAGHTGNGPVVFAPRKKRPGGPRRLVYMANERESPGHGRCRPVRTYGPSVVNAKCASRCAPIAQSHVMKKPATNLPAIHSSSGRYKIRTCDPFRVREVRYHCANRPGHHPVESIILNQPSESGQRDSNPRSQPWQGCALPTKLCPHVVTFTGDKDTPISGKSQAPACPTGFPTIIGCRRAHNSWRPYTAARRWAWPA